MSAFFLNNLKFQIQIQIVVIYLNNKYYICDLKIQVNSCYDEYFETKMSDYKSEYDSESDVIINLTKSDSDINVNYTNLMRVGENKYSCVVDGKTAVIHHDALLGKVVALTTFDREFSKVDIIAYNLKDNHGISELTFVFNLVGNAMRYVVMMHSGFVFHSSSICCNDGGVVFSALSGTGKSTHTSLWLSNFEDTAILNDDTPIIRKNDRGDIMLYGAPWAGTTGININKSVPLGAIVFLSRGKENIIKRIEPSKAFAQFFEGINNPLNNMMHMKALETIDSIFKAVPIYSLACNMDPEAAMIARSEIFGKSK